MTTRIRTMLALAVVAGLTGACRPAEAQDANAILDKAIQALGGAEKLGKVKAASWTTKGTLTFNGTDNAITVRSTAQGLDHARQEFEGEFGGMQVQGTTVLAGDKGWRQFGGNSMELDPAGLANEKRTAYLALVPVTILPLKGPGFKLEPAGEEKIGDKAAVGLKVTGPDGKDFTLHFDKESGLPVRLVARVAGFDGQEYTQETTFSDYKEMGGIQKATRVHSKRNGEKFIEQQVTEFKVLDAVDPTSFTEPK